MNIKIVTQKVLKSEGEKKPVALFAIIIDNSFAVHNIRLYKSNGEYTVRFPFFYDEKAEHGKQIKDYVHPVNQEVRDALTKQLATAYETFLSDAEKHEAEAEE